MVSVNGQSQVTDVAVNDGRWHHVCVTWRRSGHWALYCDGAVKDNGLTLATNQTIDGLYLVFFYITLANNQIIDSLSLVSVLNTLDLKLIDLIPLSLYYTKIFYV